MNEYLTKNDLKNKLKLDVDWNFNGSKLFLEVSLKFDGETISCKRLEFGR